MQQRHYIGLFVAAILVLSLIVCGGVLVSSSSRSQTMVVIGDSFIAGDPGHGLTFRNTLQRLFRCDDVFNFAVSGVGFVACDPAADKPSFGDQLVSAADSDEFANSDVDVVIVCGNTNDASIVDTDSVTRAIDEFDRNVRASFPNAAVHYCIGDVRNVNDFADIKHERLYISHLNSLGAVVHDMLGVVPPKYYEANGEHWSDQGCVIAANYIFSGALPPLAGASDIEANNFGTVVSDGNVFRGSVGKGRSTGDILIALTSDIDANSTVATIENAYVLMQIPDSISSYEVIGYAQNGTPYRFQVIENDSGTLDIRSCSSIPLSEEYVNIVVPGFIMP